jgi:hypothetical protein
VASIGSFKPVMPTTGDRFSDAALCDRLASWLEFNSKGVILFGGLGVLVSLPGSLWLAFKTGSTPA